MSYQTIISVSALAENLESPDWLILDCRGKYLNDINSYNTFADSHIPNAFYCCFSNDHQPCTNDKQYQSDTYRVKAIDSLKQSGFNKHSQIIIYDTNNNSFTDALWLQLRSQGCQNVAVLQGGFTSWLAQEMPLKLNNEYKSSNASMGVLH